MKADIIIIGAGAAGLYCAAAGIGIGGPNLILESQDRPGKKLLLSGGGQCNLTQGGDIKDFLLHYGPSGKKIRKILYGHSNKAVMNFFETGSFKADFPETGGVPLFEREDGKVFPKSLKASDVVDFLVQKVTDNGFNIVNKCKVLDIELFKNKETKSYVEEAQKANQSCTKGPTESNSYNFSVKTSLGNYTCRKLVIATGGASYPGTGSDGSLFPILEKLGLPIVNPIPALVPIFVENYPFASISGVSLQNVGLKKTGGSQTMEAFAMEKTQGDLLFTHKNLSGPVILNNSRYMSLGDKLIFNYLGNAETSEVLENLTYFANGKKQISSLISLLTEEMARPLPHRFTETLIPAATGISPTKKGGELKKEELRAIALALTVHELIVSGSAGFSAAMVTAGGVSLDAVDLKTMETKDLPNLYVIGEALDVDGDTGGYNLQFAFSSGFAAGKNL